jgi:sigma-B regulation protein RsbU (phosphoserine phosphatase)
MVSGLLRTLAHRRREPAELLKVLNRVLRERIVGTQYVALLVLVWEHKNHRFIMANAGAEPPLICRNGTIIKPKVEGVPAGLLDDREYDEVIFDTQPGDVILLHSDGITDQPNPKGVEYGDARLARKLQKFCYKPPEALADQILADFDHYKSDAPAFDDQTLLVLKVQ